MNDDQLTQADLKALYREGDIEAIHKARLDGRLNDIITNKGEDSE